MARPGVTEKEVFEAIQSLTDMGAKVTVESIRAELGHGSPNTINRHLRTWREKTPSVIVSGSILQVRQLKKQCVELQAQIQSHLEQTERLSLEILERDKKYWQLEVAYQQIQSQLQETQQDLAKLQALQEALLLEKQHQIEALLQRQKEQAEQFSEDVKTINQMCLSQVREIGLSAQEAWLEEKVKVKELKKTLSEQKNQQEILQKQLMAEQHKNEPLRKRLAEKEQIISECLDLKKFETFKSRHVVT